MKFAKGECERVREIMRRLDRKTVKDIADGIAKQEEKKEESSSGSAGKDGKKNMGTFMQAFERVAVKYAEYVEAKLALSASIKEIKTGQEVVFGEPEKEAEQTMLEMQTLNQIARTIQKQI